MKPLDALLPRPPAPDAARRARLRRLAWRWRLVGAALCCGLAATTTVQLLRPPPPRMVEVVVTARAVAAGAELTRDDVAVRPVLASLAPEGAAGTAADVLGRVAVVALPAGLPVLAGLVSDGVAASAPPGTVVVPVRLADAAVGGLLRPGDRVDLVSPAGLAGPPCPEEPDADPGCADGPDYLARGALVLPLPASRSPADVAGGLLGGGGAREDAGVTLVAVPEDEAARLSAVAGLGTAGGGTVTAVLVP